MTDRAGSSAKSADAQSVVYSPPAAEALDAFARQVCHGLGAGYTSTEVVDGFSAYIRVAADIQARHLNKHSNRFDNSGKAG